MPSGLAWGPGVACISFRLVLGGAAFSLLQEGFGMGVTEAMWKASRRRQRRRRSPGADPAPAQRAAGHRPCRRGAFGDAIVEFLGDPPLAARLGQTAREQVRGLFLNDRHFVRWVEVFGSVFGPRAAAARPAGPVAGAPAQASHGAASGLAGHDA
jgi:hypothetical protein